MLSHGNRQAWVGIGIGIGSDATFELQATPSATLLGFAHQNLILRPTATLLPTLVCLRLSAWR